MTLGERIRQLRKERGLSGAQLAASVRITTACISLYETGKRCPSFAVLLRLSHVFGLSLSTFDGCTTRADTGRGGRGGRKRA